jgi:hypothetical protein
MLQEGENQSAFELRTFRASMVNPSIGGMDGGASWIIVAVIVLQLLAAGLGVAFFVSSEEGEREVRNLGIADHNASITTYPSEVSDVLTFLEPECAHFRLEATFFLYIMHASKYIQQHFIVSNRLATWWPEALAVLWNFAVLV